MASDAKASGGTLTAEAGEELAYKVDELAALWSVNAGELSRWLSEGQFPGAFKVGRQWRVPASVAARWRLARTPSLPDAAA